VFSWKAISCFFSISSPFPKLACPARSINSSPFEDGVPLARPGALAGCVRPNPESLSRAPPIRISLFSKLGTSSFPPALSRSPQSSDSGWLVSHDHSFSAFLLLGFLVLSIPPASPFTSRRLVVSFFYFFFPIAQLSFPAFCFDSPSAVPKIVQLGQESDRVRFLVFPPRSSFLPMAALPTSEDLIYPHFYSPSQKAHVRALRRCPPSESRRSMSACAFGDLKALLAYPCRYIPPLSPPPPLGFPPLSLKLRCSAHRKCLSV